MEPRRNPEDHLKELLLAPELDLLAKLEERLGRVQDRVGDDKAFAATVRRVIVEVLRDAGVQDHERMSQVIAPLIVASLREEIRNSRDMMVDALYPITGRLVSAAVRNAFREMMATMDAKLTDTLSVERAKIRVEAFFRRESAAELMLKRFPPFSVDEMMVVHRPTSLVIARAVEEPQTDPEGDDASGIDGDMIGSMLSAILSFARDAYGDKDGASMTSLEFGQNSNLFVRGSPAVFVALKTTGPTPPLFEARLERVFQEFLDDWGARLTDFDGELDPQDRIDIPADLRRRIQTLEAVARDAKPKQSYKKAAFVLLLLLLLVGGLAGRQALDVRRARALEASARAAIAAEPAVAGYPIDVRYDRGTGVLEATGLAPDASARDAVAAALAAAAPEAELDVAVNTLPAPPVPHERGTIELLREYARNHPIFFSEGAEPRDPASAEQHIARLAELLLAAPPHVRLVIVGYADPSGSRATNERITAERAGWAASRLEALGVPADRMRQIGRPGEQFITTEVGAGSDSRRTEFEVFIAGG